MSKKKAAANEPKKSGFVFSATIEVDDKEVEVNYGFTASQFKLNKQLVKVADLFDEEGKAKESSAEVLGHLIAINSGIITQID
jgi:hypothetical protein